MAKILDANNPFMRHLEKVFDLMLLNVLTLVCCIPVITIGASLTAMHYVLFHLREGDETYIAKSFFKSFRENFLQATVIWLIMLVFIAAIAADLRIQGIEPENVLGKGIGALIILPILAVIMVFLYVFPILSRFSNTILGTIRNAAVASIVFIPRTILMIAVIAVCGIICWYLPAALFPLLLLFGITVPGFLCSFLYVPVLKRMEENSK